MSWKPTLLASRGARPRRRTNKALFVGALLASVLLAHTAVAPTGNIIILNSDAGVAKYREVETAFRSSIGRPVVSLDVASMSESALRRAIGGRGDLLYCIGAQAYKSATEMTRGNRIVFSSAINWKRFKRGDDTHVIDNDLPAETQLTLFRHFFPEVRRVGVLYNRTINRQWFTEAETTGRRLGIEVIGYSVSRPSRVDNGLRELTSDSQFVRMRVGGGCLKVLEDD